MKSITEHFGEGTPPSPNIIQTLVEGGFWNLEPLQFDKGLKGTC